MQMLQQSGGASLDFWLEGRASTCNPVPIARYIGYVASSCPRLPLIAADHGTDVTASTLVHEGYPATERRRLRAANHLAYRSDIDGLRALAVVPVVLGHADIPGFGGGFVGVDVFFVISGYLITGILVRDLASGRHSIAEFYRRRVLRIFPALFAVLAVTTAFACLSMLPAELMRYARALGAATLFSSNILFYFESGYFDAVSTTKPLLHTWSLAVEEQFYIVWPLLLALVGAHRTTALKIAIALVCVVSFIASVALIGADPSASFYLIHARAWELGMGAMLALTGNPIRARWINELLGMFGLAAIVLAVGLYDPNTIFPGAAALVPCVGALLLIATGDKGILAGRLLSLAPAAFIGRISYSLYMWHWPVIVFSKIYFLQASLDPAVQAAQIGLSGVLAVMSWRWIECPFRQNVSHWRTSRVLLGGIAMMFAFVCMAGVLLGLRGLPSRYTAEQQAIAGYLNMDVEQAYRRGTCFRITPDTQPLPECLARRTSRPSILLLGDSHAAHLWPGFASTNSGYEVLQATMAGCRPLLDPNPSTNCRRYFKRMLLDWAPRNRPDVVLLAGKWMPADVRKLDATLGNPIVRKLNVVVVGPVPQYSAAVPRLLAVASKQNDKDLLRRSLREEPFVLDRKLEAIARRHGVTYVSLIKMLCHNHNCRSLAAPHVPLQFDYGHLTEEGSAYVVTRLLNTFRTQSEQPSSGGKRQSSRELRGPLWQHKARSRIGYARRSDIPFRGAMTAIQPRTHRPSTETGAART